MIHESYPWKLELWKTKRKIEKYNSFRRFKKKNDVAYTEIEKGIFYSAFIIRKLIDCKTKLSDEADNYAFKVYGRKPLKHITSLTICPNENSHDWEKAILYTVNGKDICNWLIHSYIFFIGEDEKKPASHFFVSSDYDKNKILYMISMDDWLEYIQFVATDDIVAIDTHYDSKKGDYVYTKKERGSIDNYIEK